MREKMLRERLDEIADILAAAPPDAEAAPARGTYASHLDTRRRDNLEELVDWLRLRVRYLNFDLEATRRENRYLRQMLERRHNMGGEADAI